MTTKANLLARRYDKCPYCERAFQKPKYSVDPELVKRWTDSLFNSENS